jgi:hypothetical protein
VYYNIEGNDADIMIPSARLPNRAFLHQHSLSTKNANTPG